MILIDISTGEFITNRMCMGCSLDFNGTTALAVAIHASQQPTYRCPIFETSATALCGITGK